ncbi:MAG: PAS domain S-box protein [Chloroflexi bacterium]|nr:PAS domain S-box protein [Chloroflexota bacterium]
MTQVLIADDQEQNRYLLQVLLQGHGYEVRSARNGIEALDMARRETPDLIITDILMPGMDGFGLCRAWMADEKLRRVPLVFYTATYTDPQDEAFALSLGAARFIVKPAEPDVFVEIVRQMLENHAAQRLAPLNEPSQAAEPFYQQYSQALIRKLEAKMAQLEEANRSLELDIAARIRAEEALRESEERYRLIAERVDDIVWQLDLSLHFVYLSPAVERVLGYTPQEARELYVVDLLDEDGLAQMQEVVQNRLKRETSPSIPTEYRMRHKDGRWVDVEVCSSPLFDTEGHPSGFVGITRDIGVRKRAEEALQESQRSLEEERNLLRTLTDNTPDSIYFKDTESRFIRINPAQTRAFGLGDPAQAVGKTDFDFFTEEHARPAYEDEQAIIRSGQPLVGKEEKETWPDGRTGWVSTTKMPLRDPEERIVGTFGISRDINERKRAEAERERLLAQVQAQAQQIAQIIDSVPEGVLLLDANGQVLLVNPAGARDLATLADAAVGEQLTHLGDLPLAELFAAAERDGPWQEIQAGRRIFEAIARPVVAGGGPARGHWVLVINDVTQARDLRAQLQQQERLAAVGQLAAGIAHDFNNILAIIALQAPLVAHAPGLTEHDRERLTIISEQTGHATRLIQQLLDFSRRAVLERRPLDLGPLLKEQVKLLARTLPETIQVTLDCEPGEYMVLADPTRLQQMLMNLAVNARDAMPAGGTLRLALARQETAPRPNLPAGPWVRLTIADSGAGIAPEALAHLFEPFFTTKPRGQGTGLGLAQVHGIVKQHDGEIAVHSAAGQGATFTIYLPAVAEAAAPAPAPAAVAPPAGAEQMILIVEDNAVLLDAMADTVEMLGYRVIGADNGEEALAVLAEHGDAIALVLSDLVMPVMGGEALFRAMRDRGLTTPVVMLSGHPLEGELAGLKAQGLAGWLLKPPDLDDLARLLAQTLVSSH